MAVMEERGCWDIGLMVPGFETSPQCWESYHSAETALDWLNLTSAEIWLPHRNIHLIRALWDSLPKTVSTYSCVLMSNKVHVAPEQISFNTAECIVWMFFQVVILQEYFNDNSRAIEAKYVFPLDDNAAVCGFEAFINGKHIIGRFWCSWTNAPTFRSRECCLLQNQSNKCLPDIHGVMTVLNAYQWKRQYKRNNALS